MLKDEFLYKVLILGDGQVGKTSFLTRYVDNFFLESTLSTTGVDYRLKNVEIEVGSPVPTDVTNYISTPLTDEMKANITLDISQVKNTEPNDYQFVVTYNKATYFGIIKVYTPKPSTSGVITQGSNSGGTTQGTNQQ